MDEETRDQLEQMVEKVAAAIRSIASGDKSPDGLEGVAIALSGTHFHGPVGPALEAIAEALAGPDRPVGGALEKIADSIDRVADGLEHIATALKNLANRPL